MQIEKADRALRYQRVLTAIDGSDESEQVLQVAKDTAVRFDAELLLLSVINPIRHVSPGYDMTGALKQTLTLEAEIGNQRRAQLREQGQNLDVGPNDVHVEFGSPASVIHSTVTKLDIDLVVIGTHARHGLGLLLGSTANAVLHGATCDVLVVRIDKTT